MRFFLTIAFLILGNSNAMASDADNAASLLSRFPQGNVPPSVAVLNALGVIAESGNDEHTSLLDSLIKDESIEVGRAAAAALQFISARERQTLRKNFQAPPQHVVDTLANSLIDPELQLGRYERRMLAYAVLVLEDIPANQKNAWQERGAAYEEAGDSRRALQVFAQAAALGSEDALQAIQAYGVDGEKLILGIWTAWCPDRSDTSKTLETLLGFGSIHTVRVLANRAARSRAYHRALALDGLSRMLADGTLTQSAKAAARVGLLSGTRDPHNDVRALARTALSELNEQAVR